MEVKQYFKKLDEEVHRYFDAAEDARAKGLDPVNKVEVPIATTLAEKAVGLISAVYPQLQGCGIDDRIMKLEKEYGSLDPAVAFQISEEIAREKFCKFRNLMEAIDAGIRVGFSYITLGVVSSPIEGFTEIKLEKTKEGNEYFKAYFSGPIRSAGTTASCVVLMLIDYLRETFGFARYDPSEDEVKRYVTENYDYHERVTNLQYLPGEEEIAFLARRLPIQIAGEPTEKREVSNYKDLDRVESNFIRGGMCLIFSEGLAQKAQKGFRLLKSVKDKAFKATGWDFLEEFIEKFKMVKKAGKGDGGAVYIKDMVAGRPVYGHPSRSGAFRFRYGRCRTSGFSATAVHPATMAISKGFLAFGGQLKIEKPTKGCVVSSCDEIDGPIVKLKDGSVKKISSYEDAFKIYSEVEEIVYLGDILVSFGDVVNRNYNLLKQGYVEEWWEMELKEKGFKKTVEKFNVSFNDAVSLSRKFGVPLHPKYIFYWKEINLEEFFGLLDWLARCRATDRKLILSYTRDDKERFSKGKRALELLGVEHKVSVENVIIEEVEGKALLFNLGVSSVDDLESGIDSSIRKVKGVLKQEEEKEGDYILRVVNELSSAEIKDKSGVFVGARMGKPEKSKLRKLSGSPHVLFPVGNEGGRLRSFQAAFETGSVRGEFPIFYCEKCKRDEVYRKCIDCGSECKRMYYCRACDERMDGECPDHKGSSFDFDARRIDIRKYFESAKKITGLRLEDIGNVIKGVRGTSNADRSCEHLAKGLLRAKYNLNVNKDGTIRYDMNEMPLTHFKPKEIRTSVSKLKEMGYEKDIFGRELENSEQVLEMFPHDVVLPACSETMDERADDVFFKIGNFVEDEFERLYGLKRFFNFEKREDVVGSLIVCIAPHICTATVGRIIGFSNTQTMLASPFMHAAMRRDADGDEAAVLMLMDMLLNFSRKFLPAHRGGTQDAPLVLNTYIRAGDVDDQILDFETGEYPLELYEKAEQGAHSSEVLGVENVKVRLKEGIDPLTGVKFTHDCLDFNDCVVNSSYKSLPSMDEKVASQMEVCRKIRAVDEDDVARLIIERHFIRDTRGNLRKFSMQSFRCVGCNEIHRRPPLTGKCRKCGGRLIFTISEGSILKYMQKALDLARNYKSSPYLLESLELTEMYIHSIFGKEKEKQESISKWF